MDNIFIRFADTLLVFHMGNISVPLEAFLFHFCFEREISLCVFDYKQAESIVVFNLMSRHVDHLSEIDSPVFQGMVSQVYPPNRS